MDVNSFLCPSKDLLGKDMGRARDTGSLVFLGQHLLFCLQRLPWPGLGWKDSGLLWWPRSILGTGPGHGCGQGCWPRVFPVTAWQGGPLGMYFWPLLSLGPKVWGRNSAKNRAQGPCG